MTQLTYLENRTQCGNLEEDRSLGSYWEEQFRIMAASYGLLCTRLQINRSAAALASKMIGNTEESIILPDLVIWTYPGAYHEIKHKKPSRDGYYGLEVYRFDSLWKFFAETRQNIYYTIHDHKLAEGVNVRKNNLDHWRTIHIRDLYNTWEVCEPCPTWKAGKQQTEETYLWDSGLWIPLADLWISIITRT